MKKLFTIARVMIAAALAVAAMSVPSFATGGLDVSTITLDTAPVLALAGIVLAALAVLWPIRKTIKLSNRS